MPTNIPTLVTGFTEVDRAFRVALGDFLGNIVYFKDGLLAEPSPAIIAGMDYVTPWTRDTSFNTWFAGGLLAPEVARNTLLSVLVREPELRIGGQYWDAIIWTFGAWKYYLYTGDSALLELALAATENSLRFFEETELDEKDGLFRGGACFQDGIAAYPDLLVAHNLGSGILSCLEDEPRRDFLADKGVGIPCKALSTNALYLIAYDLAAKMRAELGLAPSPSLAVRHAELKSAINRHFWNPETGTYRYLLDAADPNPARQEGLGHAFVLLAGAADPEQAAEVVANTYVTKEGIPCVWPQIERYATAPGVYARHSGLIWPQVNAAWCSAVKQAGYPEKACFELLRLAEKASRDSIFYEIYHPETGLPYGGMQEDSEVNGIREWESCRRQTWCAAGFVNMVLTVLFGMEFGVEGVNFSPYLPEGMDSAVLTGLNYRGALLDIAVRRTGRRTLCVNGLPAKMLPAAVSGRVKVEIGI